jgi:hypothetical protein
MTSEQLTKEQRERILEIVEDLETNSNTFLWHETKEGHDYWSDVCKKLKRIANSNKKRCPKCGEVLE